MITKRTVFILGAGASMPYGFPSGPKLVDKIIADGRGIINSPTKSIHSINDLELINAFIENIAASGFQSIDLFLSKRSEFSDIGKWFIERAISHHEDPHLVNTKHDWYEKFIQKQEAQIDSLLNHNISFVTFNYDRLLEYKLHRTFVHGLGVSHEEAMEMISSMEIIHVHGSIGTYDTGSSQHRPFEPTPPERIATNNIKIVSESSAETPEFCEAIKRIEAAERVTFLGFSYSRKSLKDLKINNVPYENSLQGSCYQLGHPEQKVLRREYGISFFSLSQTCVDIFKDGDLDDE